jgi:hypothetical protein
MRQMLRKYKYKYSKYKQIQFQGPISFRNGRKNCKNQQKLKGTKLTCDTFSVFNYLPSLYVLIHVVYFVI